MISQFLFKTFIWQAFIFLGLSGGGFPTAPVSVLNNQSMREQMAEKAAAEQIGGDSLIISAAPIKTLPLALSRSERAPQRKSNTGDFDIKKNKDTVYYGTLKPLPKALFFVMKKLVKL